MGRDRALPCPYPIERINDVIIFCNCKSIVLSLRKKAREDVIELVEIRPRLFEAIPRSISKETVIYIPIITLRRIATLIRSKILAFQAQNLLTHSLAMTPTTGTTHILYKKKLSQSLSTLTKCFSINSYYFAFSISSLLSFSFNSFTNCNASATTSLQIVMCAPLGALLIAYGIASLSERIVMTGISGFIF